MRWFKWNPSVVLGSTAGSKPWPPGRCLPTGRGGRGEGKEFGTGVILYECNKSQINGRILKSSSCTGAKMEVSGIPRRVYIWLIHPKKLDR
jgi:hypothetical protein